MNDCIFCKILAGEIPSVRVHEGPNAVAFLDVNPMAKGHVLVVPRRHWADLASVPVSEAGDVAAFSELMHTVRAIAKAAIPRRAGGPVPPAFESGAGRYESDAERDAVAAKLREAIAAVFAEEQLY